MPQNLLTRDPSRLSAGEANSELNLAIQVASDEKVERRDDSAPGSGDKKLLGDNPLRSRLIVQNKSTTDVLLCGWGTDKVTDENYSFRVPENSTYHPPGQTYWTCPSNELRFRYEGGASGGLVVTEFQVALSTRAQALFNYVRQEAG